MPRVLFIENHDSFSWNVIDALPFPRRQIEVVTADRAHAALDRADVVVMGPGPTDPLRAGLVELVHEVARRGLPFLGVCLGHQALGLAFGAQLVRSTPAHGKQAVATFSASSRFPRVTGALEVMRYHSLSLREVAAPLRVVATLDDGTVMAVEHESLPMAGVQFHPDSFGTPRGRELLAAFFALSAQPLPSAPPRPARLEAGAAVQSVGLHSLRERNDFVLLGPGFADHGDWTLVEDLHEGDGGDAAVWFARAETTASRFRGRARRVTLAIDVPAALPRVTLDASGFLEGVARIRERIAEGDVYQVNLTVRAALQGVDGAGLLACLCRAEVPRFAAWMKRDGEEFVSASPELLFETHGEWIHVEPMKGTAAADRRDWLEHSEKDRAELAMITDLLRDDLHRLCVPGSVVVTAARRLIELPYVVQAVADVEGQLASGTTLGAVFKGLHPGGSVTGAPRQAALAQIAALESSPRGAYCGALGLELGDTSRVALLIRTAERVGDRWQYGVGGGITWDSAPAAELDEVHLKLGALGPVTR